MGILQRKRTLLVEMQRRNKVGGIVDRRFGENDPTMSVEERMIERFAQEKQNRVRGADIFNLEDDDDLTHLGQSLGKLKDDFGGLSEGEDSDDGNGPSLAFRKRLLGQDDDDGSEAEEDEEGQPERKKSKAEVMKEVMAKSKLHKYERQKAKEDDEEEREKLDAEMKDLWVLLGQKQPSTTAPKSDGMAPSGTNDIPLGVRGSAAKEAAKEIAEGKGDEYDKAVREMMFDARAKPQDREKTQEELAAVESERLKKLENDRLRRMRGESVTDDEEEVKKKNSPEEPMEMDDAEYPGDAAAYGFAEGIPSAADRYADMNPDELVDGDYEVSEDGYVDVDEDGLVQGDDMSDDYDSDASSIAGSAASGDESEDEGEGDFLSGLMPGKSALAAAASSKTDGSGKLAFTFPCPQTHEELLSITSKIPVNDHATVVQRIRVLHHAQLQAGNKEKLQVFTTVLFEHILYLADKFAPFPVLDLLIRHLHALSKTYPLASGNAIRAALVDFHSKRLFSPTPADLVLLTLIGTIFPPSDHFHQVVTPALIALSQHLEQTSPSSIKELAIGAYCVSLLIKYQSRAKRFLPEAWNYIFQGLYLLTPNPPSIDSLPGFYPIPSPTDSLRLSASDLRKFSSSTIRKITFSEVHNPVHDTPLVLYSTFLSLLLAISNLSSEFSAHSELLNPFFSFLPKSSPITATLKSAHATAISTRRPLELHHHRPLPIPSHVPKFDEEYNPTAHRGGSNPEEREASKLRAEIKKEKKGAMRELKKDARFISRVKRDEERATSKAYHEKMRRVVAMVQSVCYSEYRHQRNGWLMFEFRKRDKMPMSMSGRRKRGRGRGRCKRRIFDCLYRAVKVPTNEYWVVHSFLCTFFIRKIRYCECGKDATGLLRCFLTNW